MEGMVKMISRLIDMNVKTVSNKEKSNKIATNYSIQDYAKAFINGMEKTQLQRFKKMLENNIQAGMSIAENYGIDYNKFITEVKNELNVN